MPAQKMTHHSGLHKVQMHLTHRQAHRLMKGHAIQLKHEHIGRGRHHLMLHHENAKKLQRAHRAGRGARVQLSHQEMEASGEGLREFFKKIGDFYSNKIKPYVGPVLKQTIRALKDTAKGTAKKIAPFLEQEIESFDQRYGEPAVEKLGKLTGAYGLKAHLRKARGMTRGGTLISINHPALQDPIILNPPGWPAWKMMFHEQGVIPIHEATKDHIMRAQKKSHRPVAKSTTGGSFRPAGGNLRHRR